MPGYTKTGIYDDTRKFRKDLPYQKPFYIHNYTTRSRMLDEHYNPLTPFQFYRILFPKGWLEKKGEQKKTGVNAIMTVIPQTAVKYTEEELAQLEQEGKTKSKAFNRIITDDLKEIGQYRGLNYFSLISPVTYYGRKHTGKNARWLHAMTFDIDDVTERNMGYLLRFIEKIDALPRPTMIVNSGGGLHLYYVFANPIPMLPQYKTALTDFKEALTRQLWTKWTSSNKNIQIHGITQGYRVVGTRTKLGYEKIKNEDGTEKRIEYRVKAWLSGKPVTLEYLNRYVPEKQRIDLSKVKTSKITLEQAKKKYPEWYEKVIVNGEKAWGTWTCSPNLYRWWVKYILEGGKVGNRYNCLRLLSAFALKCGIDAKKLWEDNQAIYRKFATMTEPNDPNFLTMEEAAKAFHQYFHPEFIRVSIKSINKLTGFSIEKNRRNGNTREEHLALCRFKRDMKRKDPDDWRNKNGAPTKKDLVVRWRLQNENGLKGTKRQCMNDTGLSFPTIRKWWAAAEEEKPQLQPPKQTEPAKAKVIDNLSIEDKWAMMDELMASYDWADKTKATIGNAKTWDAVIAAAKKEPGDKALIFLQNASKELPEMFADHKARFEKRFKIAYSFENDLWLTTIDKANSWKTIVSMADKLPPGKAVRFLQLAVQYNKGLLQEYRWKDPGYNINDHMQVLYAMAYKPPREAEKAAKRVAKGKYRPPG